jgi:hypothetical protein
MKKNLLILIILTANIGAFAQDIRIGVKGGLNLSKFSYNYPNIPVPDDRISPGYHIGGIVNFGFKHFDIQPGVFYTTKGDKVDYQLFTSNGNSFGTIAITTTLNYIEVPVNVLYHVTTANHIRLHIGGGPYVGYGVSGNVNDGRNNYDVKFANNPTFNTASYKNPDYGLNFLAGALFKNSIIMDAGYSFGLANLGYGNSTIHNRVLNFSVGYLFR